jgi:hypothetical protein
MTLPYEVIAAGLVESVVAGVVYLSPLVALLYGMKKTHQSPRKIENVQPNSI